MGLPTQNGDEIIPTPKLSVFFCKRIEYIEIRGFQSENAVVGVDHHYVEIETIAIDLNNL